MMQLTLPPLVLQSKKMTVKEEEEGVEVFQEEHVLQVSVVPKGNV